MFRTVPPPQGDPCRRHDGTSLPHTAMSVGFLQPQKKRTVPPSVLYISRLFKIYSRTVDRPPDGGAVARGWTATPRPPLDDEPPRRRRRGGPARCFLPHPTPLPESSAQTRRSVCISSRRHSRFLDPGSFRNEFAPSRGNEPKCVLRWYVAWTRPIRPIRSIRPQTRISSLVVDRRTDRSIAVDGALARGTNEFRHATFSPRRSPSRADLVAPRACRSHHACDPSPPPRERQHRRQGPLRPRFGRCSRSGATWPSGRTYGVFIRVFI